jgi:hypothetical protein
VVGADGSNMDWIDLGLSFSPDFSPDGQRLVLLADADIYTVDADGSDAVRLTADPEWELAAVWQPSPKRSLFRNTAEFCKAERAFWGDQFASRYGGGGNAYGKCVSQNH